MKIACVLVTYNRLNKLKRALSSYENQTVLPDKMVIVDNHSNDGTIQFLNDWAEKEQLFKKDVIFLENNTGGAGGFYIGLKRALETECDWIYISDDDVYLENDVIEKITKYASNIGKNVGAICGKVEENNGIGFYHRRIFHEGVFILKESNLNASDYMRKCIKLSTYSFVGTAIRTEALWQIGLPNKDFFLWYDDTEHGIRMGKRYEILLFPDIIVYHDADSSNTDVNWKKYYGYRNNLLTLKYNYNSVYFKSKVFLLYISMIRDFCVKKRHPLIKMKKQAINDAKNNQYGVSEIYYPGVKI